MGSRKAGKAGWTRWPRWITDRQGGIIRDPLPICQMQSFDLGPWPVRASLPGIPGELRRDGILNSDQKVSSQPAVHRGGERPRIRGSHHIRACSCCSWVSLLAMPMPHSLVAWGSQATSECSVAR